MRKVGAKVFSVLTRNVWTFVVKEFNRYRKRKLRIVDSEAADLRISGVFHFGRGEGLVEALRLDLTY